LVISRGKPLDHVQFVFSTGDTLDSLQMAGHVCSLDCKSATEGGVMLYPPGSDSLPMKELPLYISKTDKEGNIHLLNLAKVITALCVERCNNNFSLITHRGLAFLDNAWYGRGKLGSSLRGTLRHLPALPSSAFA
jgi:hypothetical protein